MSAIPNALGALCLNEAGLQQFNKRDVIPRLLSLFASERHARILMERENASMVGATVDELMRHHPSLKQPVLDAIIGMLDKIKEQAQNYEAEPPHLYKLVPATPAPAAAPGTSTSDADVVMSDESAEKQKEEEKEKARDNLVLTYIDVAGRVGIFPTIWRTHKALSSVIPLLQFLEGVFQNLAHCKDFVKTDGLTKLLDLLSLPSIPYDFTGSSSARSLCSLFNIMGEAAPIPVLLTIIKSLRGALSENKPFWETIKPESPLLPLVTPSELLLARHFGGVD
jgi:E3 ubiquitin-protein ligase HUWE1